KFYHINYESPLPIPLSQYLLPYCIPCPAFPFRFLPFLNSPEYLFLLLLVLCVFVHAFPEQTHKPLHNIPAFRESHLTYTTKTGELRKRFYILEKFFEKIFPAQ